MWEAVCLAAVAAMDGGRRQMTARQLATPATAAGPELAAAASRHAVARLWDLLQDFCSVGAAPASWRGEVPPDHPFQVVASDAMAAMACSAATRRGRVPEARSLGAPEPCTKGRADIRGCMRQVSGQ